MAKLLIRVAVNAVALWVAATLVSGIELSSSFWSVVFVAALFGIVNAIIKPIAFFLSLPAILLTLGAFLLVVNAAMLGLTAQLTDSLDVDGFWSAILGAVIISIVSWLLSAFVDDKPSDERVIVR